MDWDDDDAFSVTQEAALRAAEEAALRQRAAAVASAATVQPPAAAPPAGIAAAAAAAPAAPGVKRRMMPAILAPVAPAAGGSGCAAAAAAAAPVPAADENLPPACYMGRLRYAFTPTEVDWLCEALLQSGVRAVGFDIEWRVTYQTGVPPRPVALVQLCYLESSAVPPPAPPAAAPAAGPGQRAMQRPPQYICLLLHVAHSGLTPALRRLLCSPDVRKVGVGISGDAQKFMRDFGLAMQGCLCLSDMANQRLVAPASAASASSSSGGGGGNAVAAPAPAVPLVPVPQKWSLAGLAAALLRLRLEKSQALRCSNWEARPPLSSEQQVYASTDAWASLRVYEMLEKLPVLAPPAQPLVACPAPAGATVPASAAAAAAGSMAEAADWVPALAQLRHLQPAKHAVYQAVVQQGHGLEAVAAAKNIRLDSVQGYLAEAISAGLGYSWSALGVPADALQRAAEVCGELLGQPLAWQLAPAPAAAGEQQQQQQVHQHAGSKRPPPCSPGSLAAAAAGSDAAPAAGGGGSATALPAAAAAAAAAPADVMDLLLAAGHKMRALKEERFPDLSFGEMRLALAHLGRCNPGLAASGAQAAA